MQEIAVSLLVFNEEESLDKTLSEGYNILQSLDLDFNLWIFDNCSTDSTREIVEKFSINKNEIKYFKQPKNVGYGLNSISAMKIPDAKFIFVLDGDGQYNFKDIPRCLSTMKDGNDVVFGWRKNREDRELRKITTKIFNFLAKKIIKSKINDVNCGFRAFNKNAANLINSSFKYNYIGPEIYVEAINKRLKLAEIEIDHFKRNSGKSYFDGIYSIMFNAVIMIKYLIKLRKKYLINKI